ncbi:MAG TPA: hypothetical protein GXX67_04095 [Petrimonas sp.]|nr:hypothetical protein [Petrimonas sp.]
MEESVKNEQDNSIAIISYLTLIGLVIAFVMNNEKKQPFARYHIRQSLGLNVTGIALGLVNVIPILGWIISIIGVFVLIYMNIMGIINAVNRKEKPLPILGKQYEEWFKSV